MTFPLNNEQLISFFKKVDLEPEIQKETNQVYVKLTINKQEVPLFLNIGGNDDILQTVAYLPFTVEEGKFGDMARMLHLINRDLDLPGYGMDEKENLIFYRCVIPCMGKVVNEEMLTMYIGATHLACQSFISVIHLLLSGSVSVDDLKKKYG